MRISKKINGNRLESKAVKCSKEYKEALELINMSSGVAGYCQKMFMKKFPNFYKS